MIHWITISTCFDNLLDFSHSILFYFCLAKTLKNIKRCRGIRKNFWKIEDRADSELIMAPNVINSEQAFWKNNFCNELEKIENSLIWLLWCSVIRRFFKIMKFEETYYETYTKLQSELLLLWICMNILMF